MKQMAQIGVALAKGMDDPKAHTLGRFWIVRLTPEQAPLYGGIFAVLTEPGEGIEVIERVERRGLGWYVGEKLVGRVQSRFIALATGTIAPRAEGTEEASQ